jgi:hypothetical protein
MKVVWASMFRIAANMHVYFTFSAGVYYKFCAGLLLLVDLWWWQGSSSSRQ